jgi:hypothetical protein
MLWDVFSENEKNEILLKVLVGLAKTDQVIHENEFKYLIHVCNNLKIDPELIRKYAVDSDTSKDYFPKTEVERMNIYYHLLFVMNVDGVVAHEEELAVYKLGFRLGFQEDMTREFLLLMKTHKLDQIPANAMLNIIKKYKN